MINFLKKHKSILGIILIILCILFGIATYMRGQVLKNSTETKLGNPKRSETAFSDTFYVDQLTVKEKNAYDRIIQHYEEFQGGIIEFDKPLNGTEYTRVLTAIDYGNKNYYYGICDIPMSEDNRYLKHELDYVTDIKEESIKKCILFLGSAKDITTSGIFDDKGYVTNLDEVLDGITKVDEKKKQSIIENENKINEILQKVVDDMPKEYETKEAIDYFIKWCDNNLSYATDLEKNLASIKNMDDLLNKVYVCSNTSAVLDGYALNNGYAKTLTKLCNLAGIESHSVLGIWHKKNAYNLVCVKFDEEEIYIDAAGKYYDSLGNQRYLNKLEAQAHLAFVNYFTY